MEDWIDGQLVSRCFNKPSNQFITMFYKYLSLGTWSSFNQVNFDNQSVYSLFIIYMKVINKLFLFVLCTSTLGACGQTKAPAKNIRLSQFEHVGYSDLLIDKNNVYHVVYQEYPDYNKPTFIYYTSSNNGGQSWSKPITLSNDGTGNGSGHPRIMQDGNGIIYAIWKRYGKKDASYPIGSVILDGRGGYTAGTLFYKTLSGSTWSAQMQVSQAEQSQTSWFPAVNPQGQMAIFWAEVSPESLKNNQTYWYYADWVQAAILAPNGVAQRVSYTQPSAPAYPGGAPPQNGVINLDGYIAKDGKVHLILERQNEKLLTLYYYNGNQYSKAYEYPLYKEPNSFQNPPKLLYDEKGVDHIVFRPASAVLESEQIWDIIPSQNNKVNVIAEIAKPGVKIYGFQGAQGAGGKMAAAIQVGGVSGSTEAMGLFYTNGAWNMIGLTKNAAQSKFFYKEIPTTRTYLATLTKYSSTHCAIAWDNAGKPQLTMTISADWSAGGYSVSSPSLTFIKL